jgi:hypothetical protein
MQLLAAKTETVVGKMVTTRDFDVLFKVLEVSDGYCYGFDLCDESKYVRRRESSVIPCEGKLIDLLLQGNEEIKVVMVAERVRTIKGAAKFLNISDRTMFRMRDEFSVPDEEWEKMDASKKN